MVKKKEESPPEQERDVPAWHCMTKEEVCREMGLREDIRKIGLTSEEAAERLAKFGENKLTEAKEESLLLRIWNLNYNVLVGILVFVAIVSAASALARIGNPTQNWLQVCIILAVIA